MRITLHNISIDPGSHQAWKITETIFKIASFQRQQVDFTRGYVDPGSNLKRFQSGLQIEDVTCCLRIHWLPHWHLPRTSVPLHLALAITGKTTTFHGGYDGNIMGISWGL